jgi:L-aminopeptidase/D-esterase-like protein
VHAVLLAGGSAWGLDAASGVMRWLEDNGIGLQVPYGLVPIVPAAVLFDLPVGDASIRPDAAAGYAACVAAAAAQPLAEGNVGAGAGALVGKLFGIHRAMKGGIGFASVMVGGVRVAAVVACNALGDVIDPDSGHVIAGARTEDGKRLLNARAAILQGQTPKPLLAGTNTTIGVVMTDAILTKPQAHRLAQVSHDGLARAINPVHTPSDGDTLFAMGTGASGKTASMMVLSTLAAEVTARAVVRAVRAATGVTWGNTTWPTASELV